MTVAAVIGDYHSAWDHLPTPDTPVGWATLLFVIVLVIFFVIRGLASLAGTLEKAVRPGFLFFSAFFILAILLYYTSA